MSSLNLCTAHNVVCIFADIFGQKNYDLNNFSSVFLDIFNEEYCSLLQNIPEYYISISEKKSNI